MWVVDGFEREGLFGQARRYSHFYFYFSLSTNKEKILRGRCRVFKGKPLFLDKWSPFIGCY